MVDPGAKRAANKKKLILESMYVLNHREHKKEQLAS